MPVCARWTLTVWSFCIALPEGICCAPGVQYTASEFNFQTHDLNSHVLKHKINKNKSKESKNWKATQVFQDDLVEINWHTMNIINLKTVISGISLEDAGKKSTWNPVTWNLK